MAPSERPSRDIPGRLFGRLFPRRAKLPEVRPEDVYLVSYPRSGNTWVRYLLANLLEPDREWNIDNLGLVVPDIHQPWPRDWIQRYPRIIKSHKRFQADYGRVIYLVRDGRDVAVSYYDFSRKLRGYSGSFEEFFQSFLDGELPFGAWHDHVASWLWGEGTTDLCLVKYKDLIADTAGEVQRLGDFLRLAWSPELVRTAIEKSSMRKVRQDYRTLKAKTHWDRGFQGGVKGGPGKWRETFSPEQSALFWQVAGSVAARLGYEQE